MAADASAWQRYLDAAAQAERIPDRVQRCISWPDLPGHQWMNGAARARCQLLRELTPSPDAIKALLDEDDGAKKLDQLFARQLQAHYEDPAQPDALFLVFRAFASNADAEQMAERWHAQSPGSAYALAALGSARLWRARQARGDRYIDKTPASALRAMERLLKQAVPQLSEALRLEPRLSPACVKLISAASLVGAATVRDDAQAHCLKVDPGSWEVNEAILMYAEPKWHGVAEGEDPYAAVDREVARIKGLAEQHPVLGSLVSRDAGVRGSVAAQADASDEVLLPLYLDAATRAPDPLYIGEVGKLYQRAKNWPLALGYLSQALRLAPDSPRFLAARGDVRYQLGDYQGSVDDMQRTVALRQDVGSDYSRLGNALGRLGRLDEARKAYQQAMQFPRQRKDQFFNWCDTMIRPRLLREQALSCTQGFVAEYPDDPDAVFQRTWVLYETGDAEATTFENKFRAMADGNDRRQRQMLENLDRRGGRFGPI